jgi:hypothetical protein
VATIRDQGRCPCVRCLVTIPQIPALGTSEDQILHQTMLHVESEERQQLVKDARDKLYKEGYAITGENVDGILKDESLVPTQVRLPDKLSPLSLFNSGLEFLHSIPITTWLQYFPGTCC